jgi:hypothetical protein
MKKELERDIAIQFKIYEGQLVWSRSEFMLLANTILLATITIFLSANNPNGLVLIILSIFGFLLCTIWLEASIRSFAFGKFWTYCAREIEQSGKNNSLLEKGNDFRENRTIEFNFKDKDGKRFQYYKPLLGRLFPTDKGLYFLILVFIILYIGLFILCLTHNINLVKVNL